MSRSLYWRLTAAFVLVAFITALLVGILIRITSVDRLNRLIVDQQRENLEQALAAYYSVVGSWDSVDVNWRALQFLSSQIPNATEIQGVTIRPEEIMRVDRRNLFGLADADGTVLVAIDKIHPRGSNLPGRLIRKGEPVVVEGQTVGYILTTDLRPSFSPAEALFLQRTNQAVLMAVAGAVLIALITGGLLAQTLTRPIRALTGAAQRIAQGHAGEQVTVTSQDEIGQLAVAFNSMSREVEQVNKQRRQMTADIAHDLRTPLTVIAGYIESMRDGVLQPTPQRLSLIYTEIERLQHLVSDLRVLSQADAGELPLQPQQLSPTALLTHAAETFQYAAHQKEVALSVEAAADTPDILVDEARMMQIFDNLISNALRYTSAGGRITLRAQRAAAEHSASGGARLTVEDTGTGIAPEELPNVFNRFHRADKSRHTETGESGLGLAIVKALVEAQNGRVWAESPAGQGTSIHIEFPGTA